MCACGEWPPAFRERGDGGGVQESGGPTLVISLLAISQVKGGLSIPLKCERFYVVLFLFFSPSSLRHWQCTVMKGNTKSKPEKKNLKDIKRT